jgi:hypothetical protein
MTGKDVTKKMKGLKIIGYFVWWSIAGVKVERDKFRKMVEKVGLDFEVPKVCMRSAFLMAKREVKSRAHGNRVLIRNIKKGDEHKIALVDEKLDEVHAKLGYTHSATMFFDQKTYEIRCDNAHRAFDMVKEKYDEYKVFINSYDIRVILMKIIAPLNKISVRDKGGMYFIPDKYSDVVDKLEKLLDMLDGKCYLQVVPIIDTKQAKNTIYRSFIEELHQKIDKFKTELDKEKFTSNKGWESQLKRFEEMKSKIKFYTSALKFGAEDINDKLKELTGEVKKRIVGDEDDV